MPQHTFRLPWSPNPAPAYLTQSSREKIEQFRALSVTEHHDLEGQISELRHQRELALAADISELRSRFERTIASREHEARLLLAEDRAAWAEQSSRRQREAMVRGMLATPCTWRLELETYMHVGSVGGDVVDRKYCVDGHAADYDDAVEQIMTLFTSGRLGSLEPGPAINALPFRTAYFRRDGKLTAALPPQQEPVDLSFAPSRQSHCQVAGTLTIEIGHSARRTADPPPPPGWNKHYVPAPMPTLSAEESAARSAAFRRQIETAREEGRLGAIKLPGSLGDKS